MTDQAKIDNTNDETKLLRAAPRCRLNLDDAVSVLRNLSFTPAKETPTYTKSQLDNMVNQRVQKALLAFSSQERKNDQGDQNGQKVQRRSSKKKNKNRQTKIRNRSSDSTPNESGKRSRCYDCGATDHARGDDTCQNPAFWTRKLKADGYYERRNAKPDKDNGTGTTRNNADVDFPQGSGPTKRNHH